TRSGATGGLFRGLKPPRGRHWRTDPEELEKLDQKGLVEWSRTGNPRLIVYPPPGLTKRRQDIWNFKDQPFPGYPTEKNLDLLKTIVRTSSQEGSLVLDFFCGSGTALAAAHSLGRSWIGIDESEMAVQAARRRIEAFLAGDSENNYSYLEAVY
ncbi:MAG: site-specific DNA-methyltransferase, partial [Deltaproteobacteria bacterium]|nr:site-specific DNA-methyltransferase [Deltaproteobacteria bacterium]